MVYRCYKDIAMFEEITVSYGEEYLKHMENCRCGADVHEHEKDFNPSPTGAEISILKYREVVDWEDELSKFGYVNKL